MVGFSTIQWGRDMILVPGVSLYIDPNGAEGKVWRISLKILYINPSRRLMQTEKSWGLNGLMIDNTVWKKFQFCICFCIFFYILYIYRQWYEMSCAIDSEWLLIFDCQIACTSGSKGEANYKVERGQPRQQMMPAVKTTNSMRFA